jgi:hypothetical protein
VLAIFDQNEMSRANAIPLRVLSQAPTEDSRVVTNIYRPFFLAGMLSVLTAGCLLGAVALLGISMQRSFTASAWTPYVWAHANSQLYGWVGFFIIGFSLQQHAPRASKFALFKGLSATTLVLMALGIGIRFVAEPMSRVEPSIWVPIGAASCVLQAMAVSSFLLTIFTTRFKTGTGLTWQSAFIFASLAWLVMIAFFEPLVFLGSHRDGAEEFVARWFAVYREAQFLGFVALMIFGVTLTKLSSCFGFRPAHKRPALAGLALWNAALIVRFFGWGTLYESGFTSPELFGIGAIALALGASLIIYAARVFEPLSDTHRSQKFVRASFSWIAVGSLMLVAMPLHLSASGLQFSHAYVGALAHVITVGFISQMIIGFSLHVAARMNDVDDSVLSPLWSVFWLLNIGNAARVGLEIATDYTPMAFVPMGATGFIELVALAIWALNILRLVRRRQNTAQATAA